MNPSSTMKVFDPLFILRMNPSFFLGILAAAIGFFMLFRKFRFQQERKEIDSSSASPSSVSPSSSSHNWTHQVFPSFRGEDVRINFLSHIQKEFKRKGITPFMIMRSREENPLVLNSNMLLEDLRSHSSCSLRTMLLHHGVLTN